MRGNGTRGDRVEGKNVNELGRCVCHGGFFVQRVDRDSLRDESPSQNVPTTLHTHHIDLQGDMIPGLKERIVKRVREEKALRATSLGGGEMRYGPIVFFRHFFSAQELHELY